MANELTTIDDNEVTLLVKKVLLRVRPDMQNNPYILEALKVLPGGGYRSVIGAFWNAVVDDLRNKIIFRSLSLFNRFLDYTSPLIFVNSICLLLLFKNMTINNSLFKKVFTITSRSSVAVYIIHAHGLMLDNIFYRVLSTRLLMPPLFFLCIGLITVFSVFIASIIMDNVRLWLENHSRFLLVEKKLSRVIDRIIVSE